RPLSMPALTPPMFEALLDEVLGPERRARLREQTSVDLIYTSERTKRSFDVSATSTGERTTLRFVVREASAPVSTAREQPTAAGLEALVESGLDRGASDIVLSEGRSPRLRFAGHLEGGNGAVTTAGEIQAFIDAHMTPELRAQFERTGSADLAYTLGTTEAPRRFRANLFRHQGGLGLRLRPIRDRIPTFAALGLPHSLATLGALPDGIVLLNGPAGSGKSTTLAALVGEINRTRAAHVITLEDPIEYLHTPERSLVHQREVGLHVDSFSSGLRAALRESPDVILVAAMRDLET